MKILYAKERNVELITWPLIRILAGNLHGEVSRKNVKETQFLEKLAAKLSSCLKIQEEPGSFPGHAAGEIKKYYRSFLFLSGGKDFAKDRK